MKKILPITVLLIIIDQITKLIIASKMKLYESIILIKNFFNFTYVQNNGAAWSILSGNVMFLILISVVSLVIIYLYFIKDNNLKKIDIVSYSLLFGGIIGNLIDRVRLGYVIDFLDFKIINYDFPVFNLADTFIVVAVIMIGINLIVGEYRERDKNRK